MRTSNHRLYGDSITSIQSPNYGNCFAENLPDTIILHFTDLPTVPDAVKILCDPAREVSAHVIIGRDGAIIQLVPFNVIAWHAGKSRHKDRENLNQYAIGIEIDNAGRLEKQGDEFVSWLGTTYPPDQVMQATHRNETHASFWHKYPNIQIDVVRNLCRLLIKTYPILHILGHDDIAPDRKCDPGPAFPIDQLRGSLLTSSLHGSFPAELC